MADEKRSFEIKLRHVRVTFVKVFVAEAFRGPKRGPSEESGEKAFSLNCLIPKDTDAGKDMHDDLQDLIDDAMDAAWPREKPRLKPDKYCLRDGDDEEYDGYSGNWYVAARNRNRPKVIDADGKTPLVERDCRPYSGSVCNVWIRIWIQDNDFGKRVNASLEAVQFVRDGDPFGGAAPIPDEEFTDEREPEDRSSRRPRSRRDDDDRPASRSRRDDDDRPASRNRRDDDDRPASRSRRDDEGSARRRV